MDLLSSLIQDLEKGKRSAHQMASLIQQLQGLEGVNHQHYYTGFNDHTKLVHTTLDNTLSNLERCDLFNKATTVEYNDHSTLVGCEVNGGLTPKSSTPKDRRGCGKRRKIAESDTVITVTNLTDDGYAWRKYGQKNILNEKYPRNYYRCTHKFEQGCQASKQVQQMTESPNRYRVIYQGEHTCKTIVTMTPLVIPEDHDHQDSFLILNFNNPTQHKHAVNPLIFPRSPTPPSSSTPSPSLSSSSPPPFVMVKQECYAPTLDGNQSWPWDLHQPSDLTSTSTTGFDLGDAISSSIDLQGYYSSSLAYHGMDSEELNNMMTDFPLFDHVMVPDILC